MDNSNARILVIRFSSIGDIVLTTPVFRALKQQLDGDPEIHFLTKTNYASLLASNPYIHKIHTIEKSVQEVLPALEAADFDYVIDLHRNIRSYIVKRRLKKLNFTFSKQNFRKWLLVNLPIRIAPCRHVVDRYLDTLKSFGVVNDKTGLDFFMDETNEFQKDKLPATHQNGFVAFVIGGAHEGKKMSATKIVAIISKMNLPFVLIGGSDDKAAAEKIIEATGKLVFNATGNYSLKASASLMKEAKLVITGDTGFMHIAAALGKKIISVWGCTTPEFGMSPYQPHADSVLLQPEQRSKRPCSKLGNRCKYGMKNKCVDQIPNEEITKAIEKLWAP